MAKEEDEFGCLTAAVGTVFVLLLALGLSGPTLFVIHRLPHADAYRYVLEAQKIIETEGERVRIERETQEREARLKAFAEREMADVWREWQEASARSEVFEGRMEELRQEIRALGHEPECADGFAALESKRRELEEKRVRLRQELESGYLKMLRERAAPDDTRIQKLREDVGEVQDDG